MRLICPNCDAQYEVPDDVIPADGRDVQCSSCGHTWFQPPAGMEDDSDGDDALYGAQPDPAQDAPLPGQTADDHDRPQAQPDPASPDPATDRPQRRRLDPEVANVLREEAEHEARVRATENQSLETQPELGLDDGASADAADIRARQARDRMARLRGTSADDGPARGAAESDAVSAAEEAAGNTRREMLPDIEEINSTLRSSSEPRSADRPETVVQSEDAHPPTKSGFRRGFMWMILLALLAVAVYLYADRIAGMVPQAAEPLDSYVALVDQARAWLDAKVLQGLEWLDSMSSEAGGA